MLGAKLASFPMSAVCTLKGTGSALESILGAHKTQAHRPSELKEARASYFSQ